jgi:hypothetical protein
MAFGNFALMMRDHGLPASPEEMRRYVSGEAVR